MTARPTRILFVCHGNICRSTMAEFVMRHLVREAGREGEFEIDSAATSTEELGHDVHPGPRRTLEQAGVPCGHRASRQRSAADYDRFDHIVGMDSENIVGIECLLSGMRGAGYSWRPLPAAEAAAADPEHKVTKLLSWAGVERDVADPWYTGDFEATYADVVAGCSALLKEI